MNTNKKTALLIINCLQGGGAERSVLTLGQGFYELGYEVHLLRFKPLVEYDLNPNLQYHLIKYKPYKLIPFDSIRYQTFANKVDKYVLQNIGQPDIVLSNLERPDRVMAHSNLKNLMHVIRNTVSKEFGIDGKNPQKDAATIADLQNVYRHHPCICVSKGVEEDFRETLGESMVTKTIYNAFDQPLIEQMADEPVDLSKYGLTAGQYLVHVGSFKYQKAHDVLLQAYAKTTMDYPLALVGQGKLFDETKQLAEQLGIADKVKFLGFHKNPYPFVKHARLMVLSSRFEGFVRVVGEALALNTPVVSTDCPSGPSELLPPANLVAVDDVDGLAKKMQQAMQQPQQYAVSFDNKFLPKNVAKQYVDYLNQLNSK